MVSPKKPFAAFVRAHGAYVRRRLRRLGVHPSEVDDMAQEVFIVASKGYGDRPRMRGRERAWIAVIAFRVAQNWRRRVWCLRHELVDPVEFDKMADATGGEIETSAIVLEWLASLPKHQRDIVERRLQGFTVDEIGREFGLSRSSAFMEWQGAKNRLAKELGRCGR